MLGSGLGGSLSHDLVILISDLHIPAEHPDAFKFLRAIKKKYWSKAKNPIVVNMGDELTWSAISFHDSETDLPTAEQELDQSLGQIKVLHSIFPKMKILHSNHGSLVYRRQKAHGLPKAVFKSYNDILEIPKSDWQWVPDLVLKLTTGKKLYLCHYRSADVAKLGQMLGCCAAQGHVHSKAKIEYWNNHEGLFWAMQTGCLIDFSSSEFNYAKLDLKEPVIGTGIVLEGLPLYIPMKLNANNRWTGEL